MIPAQVFCRVVRIRTESGRLGTGFLVQHAEGLAIVTAAHVCSGEREEVITYQQAFSHPAPVTELLDRVGPLDIAADLAAYSLPAHRMPSWFVGTVQASDTSGLVYSQDCYVLGYPHGLSSSWAQQNPGQELPIVKKGIIAGSVVEDGVSSWFIDTHLPAGFSGGPLVYEKNGAPGEYALAGFVKGAFTSPMSDDPDSPMAQMRTPAGLSQAVDVSHLSDLGLVAS